MSRTLRSLKDIGRGWVRPAIQARPVEPSDIRMEELNLEGKIRVNPFFLFLCLLAAASVVITFYQISKVDSSLDLAKEQVYSINAQLGEQQKKIAYLTAELNKTRGAYNEKIKDIDTEVSGISKDVNSSIVRIAESVRVQNETLAQAVAGTEKSISDLSADIKRVEAMVMSIQRELEKTEEKDVWVK